LYKLGRTNFISGLDLRQNIPSIRGVPAGVWMHVEVLTWSLFINLLINDHKMKWVSTYPKTENCPSSKDIPPKPDYKKRDRIMLNHMSKYIHKSCFYTLQAWSYWESEWSARGRLSWALAKRHSHSEALRVSEVSDILPPSHIISHFDFSRFINFVTHLDSIYVDA
jgi:hypothetical protein